MKIKISLLVVLFALTAVGFYFLGTRRNNDKPDQSAAKVDITIEKTSEKVDVDSLPEIKDEGQEEKTPSVKKQSRCTINMNSVFPVDIWSWDEKTENDALKLVLDQFGKHRRREDVSVRSLFGVSLGRDIDTYTTEFARRAIRGGESLTAFDSSLFSGDVVQWNKWKVVALETMPGCREVVTMYAFYDPDLVELTNMPCSGAMDRILIAMKQKFGDPCLVSSCDYVSPKPSQCWCWLAKDGKEDQVYWVLLHDRLICDGGEWRHQLSLVLRYVFGKEKWFREVYGSSDDRSMGGITSAYNVLVNDYAYDHVVNNLNDHVVLIHVGKGVGTGFLLRDDDDSLYLYTNAHVVNADGDVKAITMDGKELSLGRVEVARRRDLARMRVCDKRTGLKHASRQPAHEDKIVILGNSDGADVSTVLKGKVLGIGPDTIEVDARFVTGNSGSPVFNAAGEVVGVATKIMYPAEEGNEKKIREGTRFDELRYFATRLDNVEWIR